MKNRLLALKSNPGGIATELVWMNSRTRLLGETFSQAAKAILAMIENGEMIVVPGEPPTVSKRPEEAYLGDSLFVKFDGEKIWLRMPREFNSDMEISLTADSMTAFVAWYNIVMRPPSESDGR